MACTPTVAWVASWRTRYRYVAAGVATHFSQDAVRSAGHQHSCQLRSETRRLRSRSLHRAAHDGVTVRSCHQPVQRELVTHDTTKRADGNLTAALERGEETALRGRRDARRELIERFEARARFRIIVATHDSECALTGGRQPIGRFERFADQIFAAEAPHTGEREDDRVVLPLLHFIDATVEVAAQVADDEIRPGMEQQCASAQ